MQFTSQLTQISWIAVYSSKFINCPACCQYISRLHSTAVSVHISRLVLQTNLQLHCKFSLNQPLN